MTLRRNGTHLASVRFILLTAAVLFILFGCTPQESAPRAFGGAIDLSSWDFDSNGPVRLFGEWKFLWCGQNGDLCSTRTNGFEKSDRFHVPGLWEGETFQGRVLSPKGNGIYRLRINMPNDHPEQMAVLVAGAMSVCEVWINGTKVAASGTVGKSLKSEIPMRHYVIAECPASGRVMEIELRVSNYHNVQGGLNNDILLGTSHQILDFYTLPRLLGACMASAVCCLSVLYIALFYMRRSGREYLYFGLFCLFWCVAIIFSPSSGFLATILIPSLSWEWYINCSVLPYGVIAPLMLMFYHRLFPKKYGWIMERVYWTIGLLYVAYILMTPPNAYDVVLFSCFLISSFVLVYMFCCFAVDLFRGEKGIGILVVGYIALAFAELVDLLFDLHIINSALLRPLGVFVFIFSYAFYLVFRFSNAFARTEALSEELEATNVRLVQLDRLKDEFLANTTHELKTPLAGMVGIADSLLAGGGRELSDAATRDLKVIVHSGKRLSKLINDVLDLSRLKHRDVVLRVESVQPYVVARRVLALSEALKRNDDMLLINCIPMDFPAVKADSDRFEQILFNLVGNSLKFTEAGHIIVSAEQHEGFAEIVVTDTGVGISTEDQKWIFDAYAQGSESRSGGAGLGLSIAGHLVELHGGALTVVSEEGMGSSFRFSLPLADTFLLSMPPGSVPLVPKPFHSDDSFMEGMSLPVPVTEESLQSHTTSSDGAYKVLVVDDEPVNLQVVASILNLAEISFRTAESGPIALKMIEDGNVPDVVLLDVMMPIMDGYAVCRELRKKYPASILPIVLLTVKNRIEDVVKGFAAGANDYLTKPFSREELGARVATQLKLKKAYVALEENAKLKREVELRRKTESRLRVVQARLAKILDSLEDAIVGVNLSNEITFCNHPFEELTGNVADTLLGQPLASLLVNDEAQQSVALLDSAHFESVSSDMPDLFDDVLLSVSKGRELKVSFWVTGLEVEEESLRLMIVRPAGSMNMDHASSIYTQLQSALNLNRQRSVNLEDVILSLESGDVKNQQAVLDDLKSLDQLLEGMSSRVSFDTVDNKRSLAVTIMRLAIDCWIESTGTTKADMAEQSGLWNVYMERDGYFRTQTLDKYLDETTLPKRPRWKKVLVTAEFVLANCFDDSLLRQKLKGAVDLFKG
nr:response regulator [uncultured Pseudodesulfovibrio sp.]